MIGIIVGGFILLFAFYQLVVKKSPLAHIPGPRPIPLIGNVHQLDPKKPFISLTDLAKTYGGVYRFQLLSEQVVIVDSAECIYNVLVKQSADFAGRPSTFRLNFQSMKQSGIVFTNVRSEHKARRKVTHGYIKQYGTGLNRIEEVTTGLLDGMVNDIILQNGKPFDWQDMIRDLSLNIIATFLSGESIQDKKKRKQIHTAVFDVFRGQEISPFGALVDTFPIFRHFPNTIWKGMVEGLSILNRQMQDWMDNDNEDGFVNHLKSLPEEEQQKFAVNQPVIQMAVTSDLLQAGIATTSATMYTLINVLAQMPRVQSKLREEVKDVIGDARPPSLADKPKMPYHQASLLEIGRFASVGALNVPHSTTMDTALDKYFIPKGTQVITNLWSMHHNEDFWDEPFAFKPERYLDDEGMLVPADHPNRVHTMPFGAGIRVCVGEVFAMSRIFLVLATLIQKFVIEPETTIAAQPSMDPRDMQWCNVTLPPIYKVRFSPVDQRE